MATRSVFLKAPVHFSPSPSVPPLSIFLRPSPPLPSPSRPLSVCLSDRIAGPSSDTLSFSRLARGVCTPERAQPQAGGGQGPLGQNSRLGRWGMEAGERLPHLAVRWAPSSSTWTGHHSLPLNPLLSAPGLGLNLPRASVTATASFFSQSGS